MPDGLDELDTLLRAAQRRVAQIIALVAAISGLVTLEIVTSAAVTLHDAPKLVGWFAGCAVISVLARLWYKARARAAQRLREAVINGARIRKVEVVHFTISHVISFGYEVDMEVVEAVGARHLALGFWKRSSAERLQWLLRDNIAPVALKPPVAVAPELPRAQVISEPKRIARDTELDA